MKRNERREWSEDEFQLLKLIVMCAIYCVITLLIRWFVRDIPQWCVGLRVPMNECSFWINLFQTPMYIINLMLVMVSIALAIAASWAAISLPIMIIFGIWEVLRVIYNVIAEILPIPYWEFSLGDVLYNEKYHWIVGFLSIAGGITIFIISCVYHIV